MTEYPRIVEATGLVFGAAVEPETVLWADLGDDKLTRFVPVEGHQDGGYRQSMSKSLFSDITPVQTCDDLPKVERVGHRLSSDSDGDEWYTPTGAKDEIDSLKNVAKSFHANARRYEAYARFLEAEQAEQAERERLQELIDAANEALAQDHIGIGQDTDNPVTLALLAGARLTLPKDGDA